MIQVSQVWKAGWQVWTAVDAVRKEGVSIKDPRSLKQAQMLASSLPPLLAAFGLAVPELWAQLGSLVLIALYGWWNARATAASTKRIGTDTILQSS
jgi:hypothetical protein